MTSTPSTSLSGWLAAGLLATSHLFTQGSALPAMPLFALDETEMGPGDAQMDVDFPDPALIQASNGTWYSFATNNNGKQAQVATAPNPLGPWEYLDREGLVGSTQWTTGSNTWAPDVRRLDNGSYIMYYSGELNDTDGNAGGHCIGVALSNTPIGPYESLAEPWACHLEDGGAIDPAGFLDPEDGKRYVTYKVDGNAAGNGGDCGNGNPPIVGTPIMLQEVAADGYTKIGDAVEIFDRTDEDGPLVEAPNIIRLEEDGTYILFFSSFCFSSEKYNVNYAMADNVKGPYTRAASPLFVTGDFGLTAPGGATSVDGGGMIVFHADCEQGRCLHAARYRVVGRDVLVSRW